MDAEEINPEHLAADATAEVLIRDPEGMDKDGNSFTDAASLEWSQVPLIADSVNCEHISTMCASCADTWGIDYFIRYFKDGVCVWLSPDHPDHPENN